MERYKMDRIPVTQGIVKYVLIEQTDSTAIVRDLQNYAASKMLLHRHGLKDYWTAR